MTGRCRHEHSTAICIGGTVACRNCSDCHSAWWELDGHPVHLTVALNELRDVFKALEAQRPAHRGVAEVIAARLAAKGPELGADEVAECFGVVSRTVLNWANNGRIKATRVGGQWRFSRDDALDMLAS